MSPRRSKPLLGIKTPADTVVEALARKREDEAECEAEAECESIDSSGLRRDAIGFEMRRVDDIRDDQQRAGLPEVSGDAEPLADKSFERLSDLGEDLQPLLPALGVVAHVDDRAVRARLHGKLLEEIRRRYRQMEPLDHPLRDHVALQDVRHRLREREIAELRLEGTAALGDEDPHRRSVDGVLPGDDEVCDPESESRHEQDQPRFPPEETEVLTELRGSFGQNYGCAGKWAPSPAYSCANAILQTTPEVLPPRCGISAGGCGKLCPALAPQIRQPVRAAGASGRGSATMCSSIVTYFAIGTNEA